VVPDCFIPKEKRRFRFEDDRGSVRRYRLELDAEDSAEKEDLEAGKRKRAWLWSVRGN
jgi:hypothetical protein